MQKLDDTKNKIVGISDTRGATSFLTKYNALKKVGATPLLLPPITSYEQLTPYLKECTPHYLWCDDDFSPQPVGHPLSFDRPSTILFTSGTTSKAKAIVHSNENLLRSAKESIELLKIKEGTPVITPLPLFHMGGLLNTYRAELLKSSLLLPRNNELLSLINKYPNAFVVLVPTQLQRLIKDALPGELKSIQFYLGGGPLSQQLISLINQHKLMVTASYGMTETAGAVATGIKQLRPMSDCEILINERGKVIISTKRTAQHFIQDNKVFPVSLFQDKYIETADCGTITTFLTLTGRSNQTFISGGENIDPTIIENQIKNHCTELNEVKVVPIPHQELSFESVLFISPYSQLYEHKVTNLLPKNTMPKRVLPWPSYTGIKPSLQDFIKGASGG